MSFLASYTLSQSLDDSSGSGGFADSGTPQNSRDLAAEWGPSVFDVRHRFVFSSLYELPFGPGRRFLSDARGAVAAIAGGWQANTIVTLQTGQPFTPVMAIDNSNTGQFQDRPDLIGDPVRITQLLTNLVANGLKYDQAKSPQIVIGTMPGGEDPNRVTIFVRDNGIGIDPRYTGQIFDLGLKLDKARGGGPGYGLYLARKVAEGHGGTVTVESSLGEGSTFCLTLPT